MRTVILLLLGSLLISCKSTDVLEYNRIQHKVELNRFKGSMDNFAEQDAKSKYADDLVLFTGSSSIFFWKSLAEDMAPHPVLNRGFGGSTIPEVNFYFDNVVKKYEPAIIFLYCGENDITVNYTVEETYSAYRYFVSLCKKYLPKTDIVFITMKPSPSRWNLWSKFDTANNRIKAYTEKQKRLHYADVGPIMMDGAEPDKSIFVKDMLHMNADGYVRWTKVIKPILDRIVRERANSL